MAITNLEDRYELAKTAARQAGSVAMLYRGARQRMNVQSKGVQNLVTNADKECEQLIARAVFSKFPGDSLLGEEAGFQNKGSDIVWVVDPIDGTANFIRNIPFWCVSVGIVVNLRPVAGVVYDPVAGDLYHALAGGGAFRNGYPIKVSGVERIEAAHVGLGFSYRRPVEDHARAVESCLNAQCEYSRLGSGSLSLAYVAEGRLDGYWEAHMNSWDAAGGLALVLEAGGWCNDFFAGDGLETGKPILAATPGLAGPLQRLFASYSGGI